MLLAALGASLLGNMLAGKGVVRAGYSSKEKGIIRTGYGSKGSSFKKTFLFHLILLRMNINLDEHSDIGIHWIAFVCIV